jgi:uncharacterized lipoprotein YajG
MKPHALVIVVAACTLAAGCMSYSSTTRTVPAPVPAASTVVVPSQSVQQTNYKDSYTGKPLSSETTVTTRY